MAGQIVVQTSSWGDPEFVGTWYPADLPARERLRWHAQWFDAVEVNTSFYAVPDPGTVATWAREVPQDFTFDVKLHGCSPSTAPRSTACRAASAPSHGPPGAATPNAARHSSPPSARRCSRPSRRSARPASSPHCSTSSRHRSRPNATAWTSWIPCSPPSASCPSPSNCATAAGSPASSSHAPSATSNPAAQGSSPPTAHNPRIRAPASRRRRHPAAPRLPAPARPQPRRLPQRHQRRGAVQLPVQRS